MSKLEWNLKELFINNEEFNKEIKKVKRLIKKIKNEPMLLYKNND